MTENLMQLDTDQKWSLYHLWVYKKKRILFEQIEQEKNQFNRLSDKLKVLSMKHDLMAMLKCKFIGE